MGEIHELFVLALSLVWFAGATPDFWSTFCVVYLDSRAVDECAGVSGVESKLDRCILRRLDANPFAL